MYQELDLIECEKEIDRLDRMAETLDKLGMNGEHHKAAINVLRQRLEQLKLFSP